MNKWILSLLIALSPLVRADDFDEEPLDEPTSSSDEFIEEAPQAEAAPTPEPGKAPEDSVGAPSEIQQAVDAVEVAPAETKKAEVAPKAQDKAKAKKKEKTVAEKSKGKGKETANKAKSKSKPKAKKIAKKEKKAKEKNKKPKKKSQQANG